MKAKLATGLIALIVAVLVFLSLYFCRERTIIGTITIAEKGQMAVTKMKVTTFELKDDNGAKYYLGVPGHNTELKKGDRVEVVFRQYWSRLCFRGDIDYWQIRRYKILSRN